jgi:hypothetical protein
MLVLKRREGQWVDITHPASGDVFRLRIYGITAGEPGRVNIAFDDPDRNFEIRRPERHAPVADPTPPPLEAGTLGHPVAG